mmetsp:Transcript_4245/g.9692  ORF Transcript_4245/g.9692 Transcript_4245/m.9692 type:complete len:99 (+) Transcript_4245:346-642(+)
MYRCMYTAGCHPITYTYTHIHCIHPSGHPSHLHTHMHLRGGLADIQGGKRQGQAGSLNPGLPPLLQGGCLQYNTWFIHCLSVASHMQSMQDKQPAIGR